MNIRNLATLTFAATIIGCGSSGCSKSKAANEKDNPFFAQWDTPYGIPPFEEIKVEHYKPAFEEGMKRQRQEIADIIRNNEAPSYENTIIPLEYSGKIPQPCGPCILRAQRKHEYTRNADCRCRNHADVFLIQR